MSYIFYGLIAFLCTLISVPFVKRFAFRYGFIDAPRGGRKIHKKPTALLGGVGVWVGFIAAVLVYLTVAEPNFNIIPLKFYYSIIAATVVLIIGGSLDDKYDLPPKISLIFPCIASLIVVGSGIGIGIKFISNPFGGIIPLNYVFHGIPISGVFAFIWVIGMTYTTKILDGMDGLVSGVGVIGALTLFAVSLTERVNQPITATLSIILAFSLIGFLIYNFHPASIFLGEGGSTLVGFLLGVLSIILGAKIATALLVMGIPILDVAWSITRRLFSGASPFVGDRKHLHFRLLDIGLSQRQAVLVLWGISLMSGLSAVFLQSMGKLIALLILMVVMVVLVMIIVAIYKKRQKKEQPEVA